MRNGPGEEPQGESFFFSFFLPFAAPVVPLKSLQAAGTLSFPLLMSSSLCVFLSKVAGREAFIFIRAIRSCRFIRLSFVVAVAIGVQLSAARKIASNIISLLRRISVLLPRAWGICAVLKLQQNQDPDIRLLPLFLLMCLMTFLGVKSRLYINHAVIFNISQGKPSP